MEARRRAKHASQRSLRTWDGRYIESQRPPPSFWVEASTLPTCQSMLRVSSRLALTPIPEPPAWPCQRTDPSSPQSEAECAGKPSAHDDPD